jgi:hypothetical protein
LNKSSIGISGCFFSLPLFKIFQYSILSCIKKLKNNKASGEDHIINEYIKSTSGLFLPIYEKIFNLIFETGFLPDIWHGTALTNILPILFLYLNTVTVTTGAFEP